MKMMQKLAALALSGATLCSTHATAETYPGRPIRWIVGYSAGGGSDVLARVVATQLSAQIGQPVVVENRPGGATVIAADATAKSPADGYTMMSADAGTLVFNTALFRKLSYNPSRDFAAVGLLGRFPLLLAVGPSTGYSTARQLLEDMKSQPGKLSYASPGVGSPHHLAMEMVKDHSRIDVAHIAYRGAAPALQDLVGGQIPVMVVDTVAAMPMVKAGKVKVLATFGTSRLPDFPEVPTLKELGYADMESRIWQGVIVPSSTPADVVAKLSSELQKAVSTPAVQRRLLELGLIPAPSDAATMTRQWQQDTAFWPQLIQKKNISID